MAGVRETVQGNYPRTIGNPFGNPYTACAPEALAAIPTGNRAGAAVDKLLPLLESPDSAARVAAARALAAIPPGDRAGTVIDKLLPLLESPDRQVQAEAASIPVKD